MVQKLIIFYLKKKLLLTFNVVKNSIFYRKITNHTIKWIFNKIKSSFDSLKIILIFLVIYFVKNK